MKKSILTFLLLFMGLQLYAQRQGLLLDQSDREPIKGAYILGRDTVQTNDQGVFYYHPGREILIQSMGYQDLRMTGFGYSISHIIGSRSRPARRHYGQ